MRFIVCDMQGFCIPEFFPKELTFFDGYHMSHFFIKSPRTKTSLMHEVKRQVNYLERHLHYLNFDEGHIELESVPGIIKNLLMNGSSIRQDHLKIYVKGHQKHQYLQKIIQSDEELSSFVEVINIEYIESCPRLIPADPMCTHHNIIHSPNGKCKCSMNNVNLLFYWLLHRK